MKTRRLFAVLKTRCGCEKTLSLQAVQFPDRIDCLLLPDMPVLPFDDFQHHDVIGKRRRFLMRHRLSPDSAEYMEEWTDER